MASKKRASKVLEETLPEDLEIDVSESEPETESEPESESESEGDEDVKLAEPSKTAIYNKEGLLDKLGDISWPEDVDWIHKLSLDIEQEGEVDVNDDLARELAFYTQGLEGTREAFAKFQTMGIPFLRPTDYYAEMVKTDTHMEKIKGRLLSEKRRIEEAEERRKARDNKKKAKEVQAQKQKERVKQKKDEIESVKKWRKQRQQNGFPGGDKDSDMGLSFESGKESDKAKEVQAQKQKERVKQKKDEIESVKKWRKQRQQNGFPGGDKDSDMGLSFESGKESDKAKKNKRAGVSPWDRSGGKAKPSAGKDRKGGAGKSREYRDKKYGFGGKKGMNKQNTAETTNDFKGFNKSDSFQNKKRKK